jgi:hypothetical protein
MDETKRVNEGEIKKLRARVKTKSTFKKSFAAFESEKTAEEIIEEIRNSRLFTREIEPF